MSATPPAPPSGEQPVGRSNRRGNRRNENHGERSQTLLFSTLLATRARTEPANSDDESGVERSSVQMNR